MLFRSLAIASFSGQFDPSSTDTTAGFHYSFATSLGGLATTYAGAGAATSASFPTITNGTIVLYGRVFDKDGGYNNYQTAVTVNPDLLRTAEPLVIRVDPRRAQKELGWAPRQGLEGFLRDMFTKTPA